MKFGRFLSARRGISLTIVLMVITLLLVIVSLVVRQGLSSLHQAKLTTASKKALFAAEAGAADALRRMVEDAGWVGPLNDVEMEGGGLYSVLVTNNLSGSGTQTASDGAEVPPGFAYVLATGSASAQGVTRQVGVLVRAGSASSFAYAVGTGGAVEMQGSKDVTGSIKANGDISLSGSSTITPINNSGRLLSSSDIRTQGSARMDEAQEVRARGSASSQPPIRAPYLVQSGDTSESTLPFINDGRTTNTLLPGEQGLVLPNPDTTRLFAGAVVHPENPPLPLPSSFDTGGNVHIFPFGVSGGSEITGGGSLVVTGGSSIEFAGNTRVEASLIALRDGYPAVGDPPTPQPAGSGVGPTIRFQGHSEVTGMVYSHDGVAMQGNSSVVGVVIAYHDTADLNAQGNTTVTLNAEVLGEVPGFEAWAAEFTESGGIITGGQGAIGVRSWQRK